MVSETKKAVVAEIKEMLSGASSLVLADYRGLTVKEMQDLRRRMTSAGCYITIYKNRLAKIALDDMGVTELDDHLVGPTAFAMTDGDPVSLAKALIDFAKEHQALEVKAAYIDQGYVDDAGVKALAALPSREELLAKLLGTLQNPIAGFVRVASGPSAALVRVLGAVKEQKAAA